MSPRNYTCMVLLKVSSLLVGLDSAIGLESSAGTDSPVCHQKETEFNCRTRRTDGHQQFYKWKN